MGVNILDKHLNKKSFLKRHKIKDIASIFPPTTVSATTTLISGKLPGETGWIGWNQYFSEIDHHVVLFRNQDYYTNELLSPENIKKNTISTIIEICKCKNIFVISKFY